MILIIKILLNNNNYPRVDFPTALWLHTHTVWCRLLIEMPYKKKKWLSSFPFYKAMNIREIKIKTSLAQINLDDW